MTDLTKLADELRAIALKAPDRATSNTIYTVERILRSAAGVDVAGLMTLAEVSQVTYAEWRLSGGGNRKAEYDKRHGALESALRLALAAREGFVMVPVEPTPDMLEAGAGTKYEKRARNVWRDMIAAAAPKGTT